MTSQKTITDDFSNKWTDKNFGEKSWIVPLNYWMGYVCIALGLYILWVTIFGEPSDLTSNILTSISIIFFVGAGFVVVCSMLNIVNRARVIERKDELYRVEFWWRAKRKDIEFMVTDIKDVRVCKKPKSRGVKQWVASLPNTPICYQIWLQDGTSFQVAGEDEAIHEVAKRFGKPMGLSGQLTQETRSLFLHKESILVYFNLWQDRYELNMQVLCIT